MIKYNDDYHAKTVDVFGDGQAWECLEPDSSILSTRRKQLHMTQQQVADAAHIHLRQYQRFEDGSRSMSSASMRIGLSICAVLKLDPYRFVYIRQ